MSNCFSMAARFPIALRWCSLLLFMVGSAAAATVSPVPRPTPGRLALSAEIIQVQRSLLSTGTPSIPGAGVRAFQEPASETADNERFDIRWMAHPPGIPPGAIVQLEAIQARSTTVQNQIRGLTGRIEGLTQTTLEIPAREIQRAGRVQAWRISIAWRGHILARQSSPNWPK